MIEARNDHPVYTSYPPTKPYKEQKNPNAFDRRKIPSPAIFICCIFRQVFSPNHIARHLAKQKRGHRANKRAALLRWMHVCFLVFILQYRGVWGRGGGVPRRVHGGGMGAGRSDSVTIIYLFVPLRSYLDRIKGPGICSISCFPFSGYFLIFLLSFTLLNLARLLHYLHFTFLFLFPLLTGLAYAYWAFGEQACMHVSSFVFGIARWPYFTRPHLRVFYFEL